MTDLAGIEKAIADLGCAAAKLAWLRLQHSLSCSVFDSSPSASLSPPSVDNVLCVVTTTSCFAPRGCDLVVEVREGSNCVCCVHCSR